MREIEAKFSVIDGVPLGDLVSMLGLPAGLYLADAQRVDTLDVYLDTTDMRLVRHGYALRIRQKNGRQLITLKSIGSGRSDGIQDRLEIEKPLGAGSQLFGQRAWPKQIREILKSVAGKAARWQPCCMIEQERDKHIVVLPAVNGDSTSAEVRLAELSIDRVDILAPANQRDHGRSLEPPTAQFAEIEVELLADAKEQEFVDLVTWFGSRETLTAIGGNKLLRGLRAIAAHPLNGATNVFGIQSDMYMADACRLIWRQQLVEMMLNEAGVRVDEEMEYVHGMRVATRRARAAYVLLGDFLRKKQARPHLHFFKRTAKRLGRVRDLDVALKKLANYRHALPKEQRAALKPLAKHWKKQRKEPMAQLRRWLDSDAYALSLMELESFCTTPGAGAVRTRSEPGGAPAANQVRHVLPSRILSRFEAVRRYEIGIDQENPTPLSTFHALRIDCKYLRYVLEFSLDLLGEEGRELIAQLKQLQDVLGDLNDADVARAMLQDLPEALQNEAVADYIKQQETIIDALCEQAPMVFAAFISPQNRLYLANAIAHI